MTRKTTGRAGWHQATMKTYFTDLYFTHLASRIKVLIVTMAMRSMIPAKVAVWIIDRWRLRDV